jgi:hypothetical protein
MTTAIEKLKWYSSGVKKGFTSSDIAGGYDNELSVLFKRRYLTKSGEITKKGLRHAEKVDRIIEALEAKDFPKR